MSILINNGLILTQNDQRDIFQGSIYIEDSTIAEISKKPLTVEADLNIDASKKLVLPGLINTHTHVPMTLLRGYGDDMALQEWLEKRIWPVEAKLTSDKVAVASKLAFLEMISSGTTLFQDMYFFEDTIAKIAEQMGMRAALGFAFIDHGTPEYNATELFPACKRFINHWKNHELITPVIAPHGTYTCSAETLEKIRDLSDSSDVSVHTHCAETRDEVYNVQKTFGKRPVEQLQSVGLLNNRMSLAHCGWITKNEIRVMKNSGVSVSHCPVSNMKIATGGYAPVPELLDAGVSVSLGTDGAASNNTLDMFDTMKMTALVHKQHRWDPKVLPAQTVFDLATRGGAKTLGMEQDLGSLEVGKKADLILIDLLKPHLTPCHDPISQVIYAANGGDVCTTIIHGKPLYVDYHFQQYDVKNIIENASKAAKNLISTS